MKKLIAVVFGLAACVLSFIGGRISGETRTVTVVKQVEAADADVRLVKNPDGSRDVYVRSKDARTIDRYRLEISDGNDFARFIYRLDGDGNLLSSKILNPSGEEMFKISYGYRKADGRLVEERMFDCRSKHLDAAGKEQPIQRIMHMPDGERVPINLHEAAPKPALIPFHNPFAN